MDYETIKKENQLLKDENDRLQNELTQTKEHLKKYTAPEYKKVYYENNKEEIKQMLSKWCEANKEKLKEKRSELVNCECGNQYTFGNKNRHLQSKIHTEYQNQLCGIITESLPEISEEEKLQILRKKQKDNSYGCSIWR